ncbi:hypothetical protein [Cellulosimicrobium arenosum]|uniref:Uncharacterized protein n=1 Tax=Cellulosimicrobium arenosum TaxID=2708133 RepID=A0A927J075_9MICO|nr:hypothetical protein [Cellulosimicrobium arenosum]MBD8079465.1 hypothetical protein [Cellulosimicrobium arenosum]
MRPTSYVVGRRYYFGYVVGQRHYFGGLRYYFGGLRYYFGMGLVARRTGQEDPAR